VPDVPGVPSAAVLAELPHAVLAERLAEALALNVVLAGQVERLQARVEELERQAGRDSSNSSRPPSSDSPYKKKPRDRSMRERGKRRPGKQPGEPGATMNLTDDPDEQIEYSPACCRDCGTGLAGVPVLGQRRYQVTDITPPPPPKVTEYLAQSKQCPCCGTVSEPVLPPRVRARASYGPEVHAQAANLAVRHYLPIGRAAGLLAQLGGITVSAGWMAGVRGKAAALITASGFPDAVRGLLRSAPALHADETPARAAGGLRYLHVACTRYLTWMHTGDRSADAIDAGQVLRGYTGVLVRDGYSGYAHLTTAAHAWCGAHLLRDLAAVYDTEPRLQTWAADMGLLLLEARDAAAAARAAGKDHLGPAVLDSLLSRYRAITAAGRDFNRYRHTSANGRAARSLTRRFDTYEDMILCFATHPGLDIFTNNEAERTIRPVKIQQRTSGGCWRTLHGLADFATVQSYLSTAAKWHIDPLDALRGLFTGTPWIPDALEPAA
jgi:transposase